jgi:hypothetical protein
MLWALLSLSAPALADDPPDAALAWAAIFDPSPPQYKKVSQQYMPLASVAPACAVTTGCEVLAMEAWSLLISLEPQDQRRFSPAQLRIHPLGETPADDWLTRLEAAGAASGRLSVAGIAAGPYWVELAIPCTVGTLLPYEVHDLVARITEHQPTLTIHPDVAWSPCAQARFETRTLEWVEAEAQLERVQWGIVLPQGRVVAEMPD